jgi:glycolate oxidase FAD binding subunit
VTATATTLSPADVELAAASIGELVRSNPVVVPVGGRTHWDVGGPAPHGAEVRAPAGIVAYDPGELTVTVGAGTTIRHLQAVLGAAGQECPLDPRSPDATVGGTIAAGLSGHRRLRLGPLRDRVLEVRFVIGDGRYVKGGGPTVKNVTGFDVPRLLVGSLGTLGVLTQATLRCQPIAADAAWSEPTPLDPFAARRRLHEPSCIWWDGRTTTVLVEGHPADVDAELTALGAGRSSPGWVPAWPDGPRRARASVAPGALPRLGPTLTAIDGLRWAAEVGVGTVHLAADAPNALVQAAVAVSSVGGWTQREAGEPVHPPPPLPDPAIHGRLRAAIDPLGRLNPGRLPS